MLRFLARKYNDDCYYIEIKFFSVYGKAFNEFLLNCIMYVNIYYIIKFVHGSSSRLYTINLFLVRQYVKIF